MCKLLFFSQFIESHSRTQAIFLSQKLNCFLLNPPPCPLGQTVRCFRGWGRRAELHRLISLQVANVTAAAATWWASPARATACVVRLPHADAALGRGGKGLGKG